MKPYLIIFTILFLALCGCKKTNEVNIYGKISGQIPDSITYSVPVNGVSYYGFTESVKPDSLGNFQINVMTKMPAFIILYYIKSSRRNLKVIVVEPGQSFNVSINTENSKEAFKISGANQSGQNFYNSLPTPLFLNGAKEVTALAKNPSQDSIKMKISTLKADEISKFRELLDKEEISKSFFDLITVDRDCYYASMTAMVQYIKYLINLRGINPNVHYDFPHEMKKVWEDDYLEYPPDQANLMRSPFWYEYAQTYLICKNYLSDSWKLQDLRDIREKGLEHTHNVEEAKKYFSGQALEYYIAAYIYFECDFLKYEKEFIKIFDQYKTDFPESNFIKYLNPDIQKIVEYYKSADKNLANGIKFVENYEKISTLKESVKSLKGNKVYVDVWATWCAPCKFEFEHKDKLIRLLKSKGIEILYISIDDDKREKNWQDIIKYYDLKGYHIRANDKLTADLNLIQNKGGLYIPWHILIDEQGNIVKDPSEIESLKKGIN